MKHKRRHSPAGRVFSALLGACVAVSTLWAHAACVCASGASCTTARNVEEVGCHCCATANEEAPPAAEGRSCCSSKPPAKSESSASSCCSSKSTATSDTLVVGATSCCCSLSSDQSLPVFPGREQPQVQPGKRTQDDLPVVELATLPNLSAWDTAAQARFVADLSPPRVVPTAALLCTFRC